MKSQQKKARVLLIVLIVSFIIIPFLNMFFHVFDYSNFEGYVSEDPQPALLDIPYEYKGVGQTDASFNMDRIVVETTDGGEGDSYLYCPGGTIACKNTSDNLEIIQGGDYPLMNGNIGKTYRPKCATDMGGEGEFVVCSTPPGLPLPPGASADYATGINTDPSGMKFLNRKYLDTLGLTKELPHDTPYGNFIGPYSHPYKPIDVSNNLMYLHVPVTGDGMSGSGGYKVESTPCFLYESFDECKTKYFKQTNSDGIDDGKDGDKTQTFKCLADNGAETGEPLCCGQEGVLQNTDYNCPSEYPKCMGYKCGETWGKCTTA